MQAKHYIFCLLAAAMCGLFACTGDAPDEKEGLIKVGDHVPSFTVYDDEGNAFSSSEFAEKQSLLLFFDITCGDCQREFSKIEQVWNSLKDTPVFCMVTISRVTAGKTREEDIEAVNNYWSKAGFTMPKYFDNNRQVYNLFAEQYVPRVYLIDKQGIVRWMAVEEVNLTATELVEKIKSL